MGGRIIAQLLISALLHHFTLVKNKEPFAVTNGAQSMGDNDRSSTLHSSIKSLLNNLLALFIEGASCLVKNKNLGILNESTGNSNALLLTSR